MNHDMKGKTVVITGRVRGSGPSRLAQRGATVVPVGRSTTATAAVAAEIGTEPLIVDYARLADVRALAERLLERHPVITRWRTTRVARSATGASPRTAN